MSSMTLNKNNSYKTFALASVAFVGLMSWASLPQPAQAQGVVNRVVDGMSGVMTGGAVDVRRERIVSNQEFETPRQGTAVTSSEPFNVTIDGVPVFGTTQVGAAEDDQRTVDVALDAMDVNVQVDVEDLERMANVEAIRRSVGRNVGAVQFFTYWNYGAFIKSAEVRLFRADGSVDGRPVERIRIEPGKPTLWQSTDKYGRELQYVMRLYGEDGQFDETEPKLLRVDDRQRSSGDEKNVLKEALVVYGKNRIVTKGIDISGGAVTVNGKMVPDGHRIFVMGVPVPVDDKGSFVTRQILPAGNHNLVIAALDQNNRGLEFQRNLSIPQNNWFYVALADLTVGAGISKGVTALTGFEAADKTEIDMVGRAAFFLRGKISGKYLLTAMADTTEAELENLGKAFTGKDALSVLNRIDPNKDYPIYGDDSTIQNLADSRGNLYLKIETGDSHIMWGNHKTELVGADLAQVRRSLYGAQLRYRSDMQTSFGENAVKIDGFAAQPDSIAQTDEFRGTGGSVYFLNRQDLQVGSDKLRVEVRDPTTGVVLQSRRLTVNKDYDIDYIQGRVVLFSPLTGSMEDGFVVENGDSQENQQFLVARYEYAPALTDIEGMAFGGRAEAWLGDILRIGGTALYEDDKANKQSLYEVDALARLDAGTYIKGEFAQSEATQDQGTTSSDGGYDTRITGTSTGTGKSANAFRVEAGVNLDRMGMQGGQASAFYRKREAGFSAEGQDTKDEIDDYGAQVSLPVGDFVKVKGKYVVSDNITKGTSATNGNVEADFNIGERLFASVGAGYSDKGATDTSRIDVGGKLGIRIDDYEAYVFGQHTVSKDSLRKRNSRVGVGGKAKLTDRLTLGAEVSTGDGGVAGRASADFQVSDRTNTYLSYEISDLSNSGGGSTAFAAALGTLTFGGRSRYTDALTVYGEERIRHNDRGINSLTHAYGVEYAPTDAWTLGGNVEVGTVTDTNGNEIKRKSASATAGFSQEGFQVSGGLEGRIDEDEAADTKRTTYLARAKVGLKFNPDWRIQAQINAVMSEANGNFKDGDFIQGSVGFAYRPVKSDRINALFKYEGYYDLPSSQQLTNTGAAANYKQRSHILSADVIYQLTQNLSLGAKYGLKMGEVTSSRTANDWTKSTVHLGILRADWHVVRNWDAAVEIRAMQQTEIKSTRVGAVAAIYRHFGKNLKVGVGYNFSNISDDLTNVTADSQGVFINAIAKF